MMPPPVDWPVLVFQSTWPLSAPIFVFVEAPRRTERRDGRGVALELHARTPIHRADVQRIRIRAVSRTVPLGSASDARTEASEVIPRERCVDIFSGRGRHDVKRR